MSAAAPVPPPVPINIEPPSFGGYAGRPDDISGVSFWPRVGARAIDTIVGGVIAFVTGIVFAFFVVVAARMTGQSAAPMLAKQSQGGVVVFAFGFLSEVAYHTLCEGLHGSTLGKLLLDMVVVQEDGTPCRIGPAVIRSLAYFIDSIFFGLVGYLAMKKTPQEQRHGDEWAHTIVRRRSEAPPQSLRSRARFLAAFLLAAMVYAALLMIGLLILVSR
jgi:uncharacterized RDD family membrane protein YckC